MSATSEVTLAPEALAPRPLPPGGKKDREYTDLQYSFLSALASPEAKGDLKLAHKMTYVAAGSTLPLSYLMDSLSEEITSVAKKILASNSIKAVSSLLDVLDNPAALGAANAVKAAKEILDRSGVKQEDTSVQLNIPAGGLVILPAKEVDTEVERMKTSPIIDITPEENS